MVAAIAYALITNLSGEKDTNYEVGDKAPNFELTQVNHNNEAETIKLSEFEGKGVMLNFWGTWCPPCRDEMPFMEKLYPEYQEKGVEIEAVKLDQNKLKKVNNNNEAEIIKLSEFERKGVMLNFWGTWCPPCRDEMPFMEKLYPEYQEKGVEIVAVNLDQSKLKIEQFIDEFDLTFPVPHDTRDEVRELYGVGPLPS